VKRLALALLIMFALLLSIPPTASAAPQKHTYPATVDWNYYFNGCLLSDGTDYCAFMVSWLEENGGMPVFGLPISVLQVTDYGLSMQFERFRVEYHENEPQGSPYFMQLGIMGEERLIQLGRIWQNEPRAQPQPGCRYFVETGHNLCGNFQTYWTSHGREFNQRGVTFEESLSLFGFPITEAVPEVGSDGVTRMTQWFQRARMEDHGADGSILLGLLNAEVVQATGASTPTLAPPPAPAPAPPPAPTPAPPSGQRIGAICNDGTRSTATGRGACSHHGGVREWIYG
jgi:hypothetical protein